MTTDDERREAVGNLRRLSHMNRVRHREESYELPDEAVTEPDTGYHEMNDVSGRIADLIGRGGCENETGACGDGFECPACGEGRPPMRGAGYRRGDRGPKGAGHGRE